MRIEVEAKIILDNGRMMIEVNGKKVIVHSGKINVDALKSIIRSMI